MVKKMSFEEEAYFVSQGMIYEGGSFVLALGEALSHADHTNAKKIKETFPEYWKQYLEVGKGLK